MHEGEEGEKKQSQKIRALRREYIWGVYIQERTTGGNSEPERTHYD